MILIHNEDYHKSLIGQVNLVPPLIIDSHNYINDKLSLNIDKHIEKNL
jgi:hypothetical protein